MFRCIVFTADDQWSEYSPHHCCPCTAYPSLGSLSYRPERTFNKYLFDTHVVPLCSKHDTTYFLFDHALITIANSTMANNLVNYLHTIPTGSLWQYSECSVQRDDYSHFHFSIKSLHRCFCRLQQTTVPMDSHSSTNFHEVHRSISANTRGTKNHKLLPQAPSTKSDILALPAKNALRLGEIRPPRSSPRVRICYLFRRNQTFHLHLDRKTRCNPKHISRRRSVLALALLFRSHNEFKYWHLSGRVRDALAR